MKFGRLIAGAVLFLGVISIVLSTGKATAQNLKLTVRADKVLGPISPYVYGANYGPWSLVRLDMLPQARTSGITYLRFPAGNWGDDNDLKPYHIDPFMSFAKLLHAEPSISVRLKGGNPEVAAALVKYVNVEKKYGVKYWSIGNEPDLFPNYSIEQYNKDWRKFAEAMLAVDPTIQLVGPDTSQFPPPSMTDSYSTARREWVRSFLKADGDLVKIVSVHRYPFPQTLNSPATTIAQLKASASEWDTSIPELRKIVKETTGHDLPVSVTEINSHWSAVVRGEATPDSYYNAVWFANVLGRLITQQVDIVAVWALNICNGCGGGGLITDYTIYPTYYVYQLYQRFGTDLLEAKSADPDVTITAAKRKDGTLTLMVINAAVQPKSITLDVSGFKASGQAEVWRLDPDHKAERIGSADLSANASALELPAQSVSLYIIPGG